MFRLVFRSINSIRPYVSKGMLRRWLVLISPGFVCVAGETGVAEPAVAVIDSAQRKGLGRLLLARLAAAAEERGLKSFRCLVLSSNEPMRHLLNRLTLSSHAISDGEVLRIDVPVAQLSSAAPPAPRGLFHELLVAAATGAFLVADVAEQLRDWLGPHDAGEPSARA